MKFPSKCIILTQDPKIVLEEKSSKIMFINVDRQEIRKIKIDGCAIIEGIRCDYLLLTSNGCEYYIELKGCDVDHAVAQIERTISTVSSDQRKALKHSFIISVRCPLLTAKIQDLKIRFKRQYNSTLIVKNKYYECTL